MRGFLIGVVTTIVVLFVSALFVALIGVVPIATSAPPLPFEKQLANLAQHARINREMPRTVPIQPDEANLLAGAKIYADQCAICHGLPNHPQNAISQGMFPKPPQLFKGKGVTDDPPGESYWKVANGIRLTGMPAFSGPLSETQMWQVSLLVANADKISLAAKAALAQPATDNSSATAK